MSVAVTAAAGSAWSRAEAPQGKSHTAPDDAPAAGSAAAGSGWAGLPPPCVPGPPGPPEPGLRSGLGNAGPAPAGSDQRRTFLRRAASVPWQKPRGLRRGQGQEPRLSERRPYVELNATSALSTAYARLRMLRPGGDAGCGPGGKIRPDGMHVGGPRAYAGD